VLSASSLDDKIAYYLNDGLGNFSQQFVITTLADGACSVFATDLDGDGDADVLSASASDDKVACYENLGFGFFGTQQVITTATNEPRSVFATDLNGDGTADVLVASALDNKVSWFANQGAHVFSAQQVITTAAAGAYSVYATDLDGDGDQDVLSASYSDAKIAWYENQGSGNFRPQQVITTAANEPRAVYAADLDGDGDADVLSASSLDDKIAWYENQLPPPPVISTATAYGVGCGSPAMAFVPTSTAVINTAITGTISNTPTPLCVVAMGWSNTTMAGLGALPFDLSAIGMAGCQLWQSNEVFGLSTQFSGQVFVVNWSIAVPNNQAPVSAHLYMQAFSLAPGANALEVIASNGIDWLIGDQ